MTDAGDDTPDSARGRSGDGIDDDGTTDDANGEPTGSAAPNDERDGRSRRGSPFSDLADRVRRRESAAGDDDASGDPFAALDAETSELDSEASASDGESLFEEMDAGDLPDDEVWAALEDEGDLTDQPSVGEDEAERVARDDPGADRPDHVVPKASYCQRCDFFTDPPKVACTHEGTEIVAVADAEHFRVRGCPIAGDDTVVGPEDE